MNTELAHLAVFGLCYTSHELWRGLRTLAERPAPRLLSGSRHSRYFTATTDNVGTSCVFRVRNSVEFTEKNVRADPDAIGELVEMHSQSTPTTVIDGEIIIGFDRQRISEKLGL